MQAQNRNDANMYTNQSYHSKQQIFSVHQQPPTQQLQQQQDVNSQFQTFNLPPPNFSIPDLSRPPPGFNNSSAEDSPSQTEPIEELVPQPFFALPAGLMVSLIGLEKCSYQPLDPELIKLPLPSAPTEKLLSAVDAYYSSPSHERPRDNDGMYFFISKCYNLLSVNDQYS